MNGFADLLKQYRERAGLSQNGLARRMAVNPAYVNRLEKSGQGSGNRQLVENTAAALDLTPLDRDLLLAAAGHLPASFAAIGPGDPTLLLLANTLADTSIPEDDKQELRLVIRLVIQRWVDASRLKLHRDQLEQQA